MKHRLRWGESHFLKFYRNPIRIWIKRFFFSKCGYFQVQYHTFPTIEDTLFRQDLNGKGEFTIVLRTVSLNGFPILDGDDVYDEVDYFFFS